MDEGVERVDAEHRVHGDGVGGHDPFEFVLLRAGGEVAGGVGGGGRADVATFDVADDEEAEVDGFLDQVEVGADALGVELLEIGRLKFHAGDEWGDGLENLGGELEDRVDRSSIEPVD